MAKNTLTNFPNFIKKINKLTLSLSFITLVNCSAQASNITDYIKDSFHDASKGTSRFMRHQPSNLLDQAIQKISDTLEDIKDDGSERNIKRPSEKKIHQLENSIEKILK